MRELPQRCLLIDDDADDREIFGMCIERMGNPVEFFAIDGASSAIKWIAQHPEPVPSWIFLDVNMPKMNGIECLQVLRGMEQLHTTRIYMYSTTTDVAVEKECAAKGATGFIVKPVRISDLQSKLRQIFSSTTSSHIS